MSAHSPTFIVRECRIHLNGVRKDRTIAEHLHGEFIQTWIEQPHIGVSFLIDQRRPINAVQS